MAKNKIITSQGNVQFINSKGKTINMHPMHCYAVYENDTVSFLFIYMKEYSGQAFFASQYEDVEVNGESYDNMDDLKEAISYAFAKAGAQARTEIVEELPEDPFTNTIYLLPKEHGEGYDEYIWNEEKGWQLIGDTDIEFERYLQIADFNPYSADTKDYIDAVSGNTVQNATDIVALSGAIDTEISARTDADSFISGAVDTVSSGLTEESQRAISAETALGGRIDTVNGRVDAEQIARAQADTAISGAVDTVSGITNTKADKVDAVASAEYVASAKTINFMNISGTVISSIDATDFVVDGMIEDVRIDTISGVSYLVIDFNTESGIEDIEIPLSDIFNPDNYYDKTAIDNIVSGLNESINAKADDSDLAEDERVIAEAFNDINDKIDTISGDVQSISGNVLSSGDVQTQIDSSISGKVDTSDFETYSASVETALSGKANDSDLAEDERVIAEAFNDVNDKIHTISGDVITLGDNVQTLSGKVDTISGSAITSGDVQTQIDNSISGKADKTEIYTYIGTDRIKVSTAGGVRRKSIDLNIPIYSGDGVVSISCNNPSGTGNGMSNISGNTSFGAGFMVKTNNAFEAAFGTANASNGYTQSMEGNSGNTLFSVGNGTADNARHNAFEIRQNGDIYIANTDDTSTANYYQKPMVRLQDYLGGGGASYSAGTGIDITNDVISVTGMVATSAVTSAVTSGSTAVVESGAVYSQLGGLKLVKLTQTEYDNLSTKDNSTLYIVIDS